MVTQILLHLCRGEIAALGNHLPDTLSCLSFLRFGYKKRENAVRYCILPEETIWTCRFLTIWWPSLFACWEPSSRKPLQLLGFFLSLILFPSDVRSTL